jgi:hypothetical protein
VTLLQNRFLAASLVAISGLLVAIMFGLVIGGGADPVQFSDPGPLVRFDESSDGYGHRDIGFGSLRSQR